MAHCTVEYASDGSTQRCQRPVIDDHERCVFHLSPGERDNADVTASQLASAFLADVRADDPTRREYVGVHLEGLDLSAHVLDGSDVGALAFRDVTVEGTLDLSGVVVGHPMELKECEIGQFEATDATFELGVTVEDTVFGGDTASATGFRVRRGSFERGLHVSDTRFEAAVEFAACQIDGWLDVDDVTFDGPAHFPKLGVGTAQFVGTAFERGAEFGDADADQAIFQDVRLPAEDELDVTGASVGLLRVDPGSGLTCRLDDATVSSGRLAQPEGAVACYDLTDATIGDVALECDPDTFDRYRFYRTRFDGFPFAAYRAVLRANRWQMHEYVGTPAEPDTTEGLEHTYLEAKQGASMAGDSETASKFFVRELRYRRQRYGAHARAAEHTLGHRTDAALRWVTNGFLDLVAGYGERPQRTLLLAAAVMLGSAIAYPATGGLVTGTEVIGYGTHGLAAALDGLYFSVVTFATLGLGDVHPAGTVGRFIAASEGLVGAFLTAVFVFSLGRRVTR